jgi:hypothetical protein
VAVPGMPAGSPGMGGPPNRAPYSVFLLQEGQQPRVLSTH